MNKAEKARELFDQIAKKNQENLFYYNSNRAENLYEEIYIDVERYRSLLDIILIYEEGEFLETSMEEFNGYLDLFM